VRLPFPLPPSGRLRVSPGVVASAVIVLASDQLTKSWITQNLGQPGQAHSVQILGDIVRLSYTTNSGAAFGMFPAGTVFFTCIALIAAPVLLFARDYVRQRAWWMSLIFGMLLGGTLGNLVDRLRQGRVVDFVDVGVGDIRWWSFNVADSSFVVAVIILAIYLSVTPDETSKANDDRASVT